MSWSRKKFQKKIRLFSFLLVSLFIGQAIGSHKLAAQTCNSNHNPTLADLVRECKK